MSVRAFFRHKDARLCLASAEKGVRQIYEGRKEALKGKGQRLKQAELRQLYEK